VLSTAEDAVDRVQMPEMLSEGDDGPPTEEDDLARPSEAPSLAEPNDQLAQSDEVELDVLPGGASENGASDDDEEPTV
jgi:hypothetical protein